MKLIFNEAERGRARACLRIFTVNDGHQWLPDSPQSLTALRRVALRHVTRVPRPMTDVPHGPAETCLPVKDVFRYSYRNAALYGRPINLRPFQSPVNALMNSNYEFVLVLY